ncbi:hypothetical protein COLO4_38384 [Corchorus olitorius]|uniref:Uncharacterized protein n=1 Tax=Corchorus olitorius TaxID=93759 RepID=A0A1R3FVC2_9ROSI|nr:hypothetical protein COLO4_38384 [Corchorus olitorius]
MEDSRGVCYPVDGLQRRLLAFGHSSSWRYVTTT